MAFTGKDWKDEPDHSTPLSAAALEDVETRLSAYTNSKIAWFDVKDSTYGATGDGTTNDSTAIQAAIDACYTAGGGIVYFPAGVYVCNVIIKPKVVLQGQWAHTTLVSATGTSAATVGSIQSGTTNDALDPFQNGFVNLYFNNSENNATGWCCELVSSNSDTGWQISGSLANSPGPFFHNVKMVNGYNGLKLGVNMRSTATDNLEIKNMSHVGMQNSSTDSTFNNIQITGCGDALIEAGFDSQWNNLRVNYSYGTQGRYTGNARNLDLTGSRNTLYVKSQDSYGVGIRVTGSENKVEGQAGGDTGGSVMIAGGAIKNEIHVNTIDADRTRTTLVLVIDGATTGPNTLRLGYNPASLGASPTLITEQNSGLSANNDIGFVNDAWHEVGGTGEPAFANSWVNFGGAPTAAFKNVDGFVTMKGKIKSGTINTTAFTLPIGYRPKETQSFATNSTGALGILTVNSDGTVVPGIGSNTNFWINCTFKQGS